jgi:hypothetical protein
MKTVMIALSFLILLFPSALRSEMPGGTMSVGARVGSLTGVDFKYWMNSENAIELALGATPPEALVGEFSYLWHMYNVFRDVDGILARNMPLYFGVGGHFAAGNVWPRGYSNGHFAARFPSGVNFIFRNHPFDVFLEVAPTLYIAPFSALSVHAGLGGRYRF